MSSKSSLFITTVILTVSFSLGQARAGSIYMDEMTTPSLYNGSRISEGEIFNFSGSNDVCPDNKCKVVFQKNMPISDSLVVYNLDLNNIGFTGDFLLQDNKSFGSFGPLKRNLVERMNVVGWCNVNDIIEKGDYAKYICNDGRLTLTRQYNNTSYEYRMNATMELPSRHYVVHARQD